MNRPSASSVDPTSADHFTHSALFYADPDEFVVAVLPFLLAGLAAQEPVAAVLPPHNLELVRDKLGADAERVLLLDMTDAGRNPGRLIPGVLRAFADSRPDRPVRIVSESIWPGRSDLEYPACARNEALINLAFDERKVAVLCPFQVSALTDQARIDASRTHGTVVTGGGWQRSEEFAPEQVLAEYNVPLVPPEGRKTMTIGPGDLADLRRFTATSAGYLGLRRDRVEDLVLVINELVSNSIEHGGGEATVSVFGSDSRVGCQVFDTGQLTDPLAGQRPANGRQPRGRGLLMVNQLSDLVRTHVDAAGTTIQAWFSR